MSAQSMTTLTICSKEHTQQAYLHIVKIYIYVIFAIYFVIFSSLTKVTIFVCLFVDYKNLTMTSLKHTVNVVYFVNNFADTESA